MLPVCALLGFLVGQGGAAPIDDERVLVRSDHAEVVVSGERYRLVTAEAPLRAVIVKPTGKTRLVVNVVRLGEKGDDPRGGTPLVVTVGKKRHVFPNRPGLVESRRVERSSEERIASFPVRYPLRLKGGRGQVPVRVALRRPDRGGEIGIRLTLEEPKDTLLTPLSPVGENLAAATPRARRDDGATRQGRRRGRRGRSPKPAVEERAEERIARGDDDQTSNPPPPATAPPGAEPPASSIVDAGPPPAGPPSPETADAGPRLASAAPTPPAAADEDDAGTDAGPPATPPAAPWVKAPDPPPPQPGAALRVVLHDDMGSSFRLEEVELTIDGRPVALAPRGAASPGGSRPVLFEGRLPAGPHDVAVHLAYVGDGGWFFSYLDAYTFHLSDAALVELDEGGAVEVSVIGEEAGGWFAELEDRPSLRFRVHPRR